MPMPPSFAPGITYDPGTGRPRYTPPKTGYITPRQPDNTGEHFPGQPNVVDGGFYDRYIPPPTVPPGYQGIVDSPVNNGGGLNPDGSVPPPGGPFLPEPPQVPENIDQPRPNPREYGTFRAISQRGGPEFRPSNTQELLRKAAARRLGLD